MFGAFPVWQDEGVAGQGFTIAGLDGELSREKAKVA